MYWKRRIAYLYSFVIYSLLLVEGFGYVRAISIQAEHQCLWVTHSERATPGLRATLSLYWTSTWFFFFLFFMYLFNFCPVCCQRHLGWWDPVLGMWPAGTKSMLRADSNSWMGSLQVVMTFSHNLCEANAALQRASPLPISPRARFTTNLTPKVPFHSLLLALILFLTELQWLWLGPE